LQLSAPTNNLASIDLPVASLASSAAKFISALGGISRAVHKDLGDSSSLVSEESAGSENTVDHESKENSNKNGFHFWIWNFRKNFFFFNY